MDFEIQGRKANVRSINARALIGVAPSDDVFIIVINLIESIEGIMGFAIELPKTRYERMRFPMVELPQWIEHEANAKVKELIALDQARAKRADHLAELNRTARTISRLLDVPE